MTKRQGESDSEGERRSVCLDVREALKEKDVQNYNLTLACSLRRTDTGTDIHTEY